MGNFILNDKTKITSQAEIDLWVIDAKLGDEKSFEQLFKHFQQGLLRYAYKIYPDPQMAQEAAQRSWIKIAKNVNRLNDHHAFKSWLFQTLHWQMLDLLRKQKNAPVSLDMEVLDSLPAQTTKSSQVNSQHSELHFHISQLADIDKQAIHLFYLEELSLQEIHIVLNIPIGTIKSRLNRARHVLKNKLINS